MRLIIILTITLTFGVIDSGNLLAKFWKLNTLSECQLTIETISTSIGEIIKYKLVPEKDTLITRIDFHCKGLQNAGRLEIEKRVVLINTANKTKKKANILLTSFQKDQEGLNINFKSFSSEGEDIIGTIEFECIDEKYVVKDFYFLRGFD